MVPSYGTKTSGDVVFLCTVCDVLIQDSRIADMHRKSFVKVERRKYKALVKGVRESNQIEKNACRYKKLLELK